MRTTPFREFIHQRFDPVCKGKLDRDDVLGIIAYSEEVEKEKEVLDFLCSRPDATLRETIDYVFADLDGVEMEIVDDDEMDEDWEE